MIQGLMRCGTSAHILGIGVENHDCEDDETLEIVPSIGMVLESCRAEPKHGISELFNSYFVLVNIEPA